MGNANQASRLQDDLDISALRGQTITFHSLHSDSIHLSYDNRVARRVSSFRGICFSSRPICIGERLYIKITDVTSSSQLVGRDGVLRVGLLSDNPSLLNTADLQTYACPDITYEQGYWAKAVPEPMARLGNVLFFFVTANGDVMYGLNGKEIGVFFGGVQTDLPLWALMDLYGSTSCVELIDGAQIGCSNSYSPAPIDISWLTSTRPLIPDVAPFYPLPATTAPPVITPAWPGSSTTGSLPILLKSTSSKTVLEIIDPMPFHFNSGRNIFFSHNRTVASRGKHDYCNGYVFTNRPLVPGEKLIISVLSITNEYSGGLTFGMTSCDPGTINELTLPDDSDLLLDFPDYWVVHRDVYMKPEINDELTFHLTLLGEVRYSKNGHHIGTLMHVDTTLPLWAFFDIYGSTEQIKSLGVITPLAAPVSTNNATVSRYPSGGTPKQWESSVSTNFNSATRHTTPTAAITSSQNVVHHRPAASAQNPRVSSLVSIGLSDAVSSLSVGGDSSRFRCEMDSGGVSRQLLTAESPAPALPPKMSQNRSPSFASRISPPVIPVSQPMVLRSSTAVPVSPLDLVLKVSEVAPSLPPPLIPMPGKAVVTIKPDVKPVKPKRRAPKRSTATPQTPLGGGSWSGDACDPGQECVICMERVTDCALYTCGHMCMCYECAVDIVKNQSGLCPICREQIRDIIKIFRS